MFSVSLESNTPDLRRLGPFTLVRGYRNRFTLTISNDADTIAEAPSVSLILESYVGQQDPILFTRRAPTTLDDVEPHATATIDWDMTPHFPGLAALAVHITNHDGAAAEAKRKDDKEYAATPVRWWFHVADDISVEIRDSLAGLLKHLGGKK